MQLFKKGETNSQEVMGENLYLFSGNLRAHCVTFNPTFQGRSEIPESFRKNSRTAMMSPPDFAQIIRVKLAVEGLNDANDCA